MFKLQGCVINLDFKLLTELSDAFVVQLTWPYLPRALGGLPASGEAGGVGGIQGSGQAFPFDSIPFHSSEGTEPGGEPILEVFISLKAYDF